MKLLTNMLSADRLSSFIWSTLKLCHVIQYFHFQVIHFDFHFPTESDLLNALPSYSSLPYILLDLKTYYFIFLTGNNPFSSWFIHSVDTEKRVIARYTSCNTFLHYGLFPFASVVGSLKSRPSSRGIFVT